MNEIKPGDFYWGIGCISVRQWRVCFGTEITVPVAAPLLVGRSAYGGDYPWRLNGRTFHCGDMENFVEVSRKEGILRVRLETQMFLLGQQTEERPLAFTPDAVFSGVRFEGHVWHYSDTSACGGSIRFAAESVEIVGHEPDEPIFATDLKSRGAGDE